MKAAFAVVYFLVRREKKGKSGRHELMIGFGDLVFIFFALAVSAIVLAIYRIVDHTIRKWLK